MKYVLAAHVQIVNARPQVIEIVGDAKTFKTSKHFWWRRGGEDIPAGRDTIQTALQMWDEDI